MKKIYTFGAIALAVLATLSCKQELSVEVQPADNLFHIYATRENPLTKTGWTPEANDYSIAWGPGDCLSVFATDDPNPVDLHNLFFYIEDAAAYTAYVNSGYKTISFTHGSAQVPGTAPYWAIFPYDRSNVMDTGHPQIPFIYEQTASAGFFDSQAYAAVAKSDNFIFSFKNLFGLLAIKVGDANVTSIKLKNKSEGDGFQSRYTIGFYEDGVAKKDLIRRMSIETAIKWMDNNCDEHERSDIQKQMDYPTLIEEYPNPSDRLVECIKAVKAKKKNPRLIYQ